MNNEIFTNYFTDRQIAALLGITLGGLRNKICRKNVSDLPEFIVVNSRTRLWHKEKTHTWLMTRYQRDKVTVDRLMKTAVDCLETGPEDKVKTKNKTKSK